MFLLKPIIGSAIAYMFPTPQTYVAVIARSNQPQIITLLAVIANDTECSSNLIVSHHIYFSSTYIDTSLLGAILSVLFCTRTLQNNFRN